MANVLRPRPSNRTTASITLSTAADGASEQINLTGLTLAAILMPASWTDARIGLQCSIDGSTFTSVYNTAGDHLTFLTSANRMMTFDNTDNFAGLQLIKIISETTAGVAVAQAASRTLKLVLSEG
ncbi:hypothetical protein [Pseudomonas fluorescens]|uniref:hypothetical protein n=1 Tax=Pseudomonas fluorescens TaxID=294 RepID=UPI00178157AC|nr:hypothetical protein [Pseudomonas fluorescens]